MKEKHLITTKDICLMAVFTVILFLQKEILSGLPNIQLTVFLMILYSKIFGFKKTSIIIIIYFSLDMVVMGTFNPLFAVFQLVGWLLIPTLTCSVFKKIENPFWLALISILFSLLYSWLLIIPGCITFKISFITYFIADLPFEGLMVGSSFLSTLLLYSPLKKSLHNYFIVRTA